MATSSIFTNVVIKTQQEAEMFVKALDEASREPKWTPPKNASRPITDRKAIRALMAKKARV